MKRRIIFVLLLLVACHFLYGQDTVERVNHFFVLGIGPSVPVEQFGQRAFVPDAGFATLGANIEADYYIFPARYFGFNACLGAASWGIDQKAMTNEYYRILGKSSGVDLSAGRYQSYRFLLGLALRTPVVKRFELLFRCQVGIAYSVHPQISVVDSEYGLLNQIERSSTSSLQAGVGAMLTYYLNDKYGINFSYSGNSTDPGFSDSNSADHKFDQPLYYRNFNLGLTIKF